MSFFRSYVMHRRGIDCKCGVSLGMFCNSRLVVSKSITHSGCKLCGNGNSYSIIVSQIVHSLLTHSERRCGII